MKRCRACLNDAFALDNFNDVVVDHPDEADEDRWRSYSPHRCPSPL